MKACKSVHFHSSGNTYVHTLCELHQHSRHSLLVRTSNFQDNGVTLKRTNNRKHIRAHASERQRWPNKHNDNRNIEWDLRMSRTTKANWSNRLNMPNQFSYRGLHLALMAYLTRDIYTRSQMSCLQLDSTQQAANPDPKDRLF